MNLGQIVLTSTNKVGVEPHIRIPVEKITLLQRQTPASGKNFTAVFLLGHPPYAVDEMPDEIAALIDEELYRQFCLMKSFEDRHKDSKFQNVEVWITTGGKGP